MKTLIALCLLTLSVQVCAYYTDEYNGLTLSDVEIAIGKPEYVVEKGNEFTVWQYNTGISVAFKEGLVACVEIPQKTPVETCQTTPITTSSGTYETDKLNGLTMNAVKTSLGPPEIRSDSGDIEVWFYDNAAYMVVFNKGKVSYTSYISTSESTLNSTAKDCNRGEFDYLANKYGGSKTDALDYFEQKYAKTLDAKPNVVTQSSNIEISASPAEIPTMATLVPTLLDAVPVLRSVTPLVPIDTTNIESANTDSSHKGESEAVNYQPVQPVVEKKRKIRFSLKSILRTVSGAAKVLAVGASAYSNAAQRPSSTYTQPLYSSYNTQQNSTYLGQLSVNTYNPDSISNKYSAYGNPYGQTVTNKYSNYGSPYSPQSPSNPYATDTPKIYASDGTYLGKLSSNKYDPESISNPYGVYGSKYGNNLMNPYSQYGSKYSSQSWANPYTTTAPVVFSSPLLPTLPTLPTSKTSQR